MGETKIEDIATGLKTENATAMVARNLQHLRRQSPVTEQEMADELEISLRDYCKIEEGSRPITVEQLWQASQSLSEKIWKFFEGIDNSLYEKYIRAVDVPETTKIRCAKAAGELAIMHYNKREDLAKAFETIISASSEATWENDC